MAAWWRSSVRRVQPSLRAAALGTLATLLGMTAISGTAAAQRGAGWSSAGMPSQQSSEAIGKYNAGCLAGGAPIPQTGPGFQLTEIDRNRRYAHPDMVAYILDLGLRMEEAGLGRLTVEDVSQPRGGPMPSGHRSHQMGLDADIWYRLDAPPTPTETDQWYMVPSGFRDVDTRVWTDRQAETLRLAATDPRVARIFVNPGVKQALCDRRWANRDWLRVVRPWFGHSAHFHVRLNCPVDSPACEPQEPPPEGDGCGSELASWFEPPPTTAPTTPKKPYVPPPLPAACEAVLSAP